MKKYLLILLLALFAVPLAQAEPLRLDLKESIAMAMQKNADLQSKRYQEKQAETENGLINGEFGPHFDGVVGVGPITEATGNATNAVVNKDVWGRSFLGSFQFTMPIYTWDRKTKYKEAAAAGVEVKKQETRSQEIALRYDVKEVYYGILYTASLLDFIHDGKKDLQQALDKAQKKKTNEKENYRLELFLNEVAEKEAEVEKHYEMAKAGFALRVGNMESGTLMPKDEWLSFDSRKLEPFEHYVALMKDSRPELKELDLGIKAKRDVARAEWRGLLPIFGFLLNYDFASTNVRTQQPGVFAYDPYNKSVLSAGVGLKLDLQYGVQKAKAQRATAEAEELEAKQEYANVGIADDVRRAYLEVQEAEKRLDAATAAYKTGKKWLTGEVLTYGAGLGKTKELVEAYGARAETAKTYFEAVFQHHMAWAALSRAVGQEVDPLLE